MKAKQNQKVLVTKSKDGWPTIKKGQIFTVDYILKGWCMTKERYNLPPGYYSLNAQFELSLF